MLGFKSYKVLCTHKETPQLKIVQQITFFYLNEYKQENNREKLNSKLTIRLI